MTKQIPLLAAIFIGLFVARTNASEPYSINVTVGTTFTIAPKRTADNAGAWVAATVYAQGQYAKSNNKIYMALVGGTTSSTAPSHASGTAADNTVTWLRVLNNNVSKRASVFIFKTDAGAGVSFLSPGGATPTVTAGVPLSAQYSYYEYEGNGEVRAVSTNATVTLSIQEVEAP
jgi:hypothetical protein